MKLSRRCLALAAVSLLAILPATTLAGDPGFRHEYVMRGQVLEAGGERLVVCVGKRDGVEVGQTLEVVRHVRVPGGPKQVGNRYRRERVGSVRVTGLVDEHYADAQVVEGKVQVNDTVELVSR